MLNVKIKHYKADAKNPHGKHGTHGITGVPDVNPDDVLKPSIKEARKLGRLKIVKHDR